MAESNRRGEDAADDRLDDEAIEDAVDEDADEPVSRGGTATRSRKKTDSAGSRSKTKQEKAKKDSGRVGIFGRIARFAREVVAELRKVIWPNRKELLTYTAVVVVFVAVIMAVVAGLDFAFAKGVLWVFGNPS